MVQRLASVRLHASVVIAAMAWLAMPLAQQPPQLSKLDRNRLKQMLEGIGSELKKSYYDPAFGGRDIDEHLAAAKAKLETASSLNHGFAVIAQALVDLEDSHTFFIPPARTASVEYGWRLQMHGDKCYIVAVKPGSDAAAKGLAPGDQVISVDGFFPNRDEMWKLEYSLYVIRPRTAATLVLQAPGEGPRTVTVASEVTESKRVIDLTQPDGGDLGGLIRQARTHAPVHHVGRLKSVTVWRMPSFAFLDAEEQLDRVLKAATDLILDLRGNPGGLVAALEHVAGRLFDREVTIADVKGRKAAPPLRGRKSRRPFTGRVVALIDSKSGSAAELLARVLQLERRGTVIGDRSSGSVRQARRFRDALGLGTVVFYGASITNADLIMSDGKSLEHVGVVPDEVIIPTAADLAAGRDPVLARATELLGVGLTPELAGKLFPTEWR
jgi:carboxyl-terminal processing protease